MSEVGVNLDSVNQVTNVLNNLIINKQKADYEGKIKVGVDLGTANIVISVVDESNRPIAGALQSARVVKDGVVVDYLGATKIVKELKRQVEELLGREITQAATAIPPGVEEGSIKVITNVIESAFIDVTKVVDEPTAAASVLGITDGAVVDVGGGTTGISILKDGEVIFTADEPTGGTHMTLVTAGRYQLAFEEAENFKKDKSKEKEVFVVVSPVIQKMASIVKKYVEDFDVDVIYVVGGACIINGFEKVFEKEIGIRTIKPDNALLVTPLGIAIHSE